MIRAPAHPNSVCGQNGVVSFDPTWWMRTVRYYPDGRTRIHDGRWLRTKDGDPAFMIPLRHHYSGAGKGKLGLPPGRKLALVQPDGLAIAGFTLQRYRADGQKGICMNVFARYAGARASVMILDAQRIAREQLGDHRLFTFVNPRAVKSPNPGYCFKCAGWKTCGTSRRGLIILENLP